MAGTDLHQRAEDGNTLDGGRTPQMATFELEHDAHNDPDRERLARLGKKQVLKVNYGKTQ